MRLIDSEYQQRLKRALGEKSGLSMTAKTELFAKADALLSARRERLNSRELEVKRASQARADLAFRFRKAVSDAFDALAIHPDAPAAAMTLATLLLAFLALHRNPHHIMNSIASRFPEFPRNNDVPARYDAQRQAEELAYEREVEDAHKDTSGGI